jgi:hypothetical protein
MSQQQQPQLTQQQQQQLLERYNLPVVQDCLSCRYVPAVGFGLFGLYNVVCIANNRLPMTPFTVTPLQRSHRMLGIAINVTITVAAMWQLVASEIACMLCLLVVCLFVCVLSVFLFICVFIEVMLFWLCFFILFVVILLQL